MNNGIQPTVELATTNGTYPYPVVYGNNGGGFGNNGGFLGGDGWIVLLLLLAFGGFGNNGNNGGFFGGRGFDDGYAWLSNGQKEIMQNTNNGFDTLHLSNQIEGVRDGIYGLSNQLCNCCADMSQTVSNGFYNAEIAANSRQIADMNQNFSNQITTLQGFNGLQKSLDNCCCENRLGIANLNSTILAENCADREVLREIGQNILVNQTENTNRIIAELFKDRLDEKDDKIAELNRQILMKDLQASQIAQNSFIAQGFANEVDQLYNRLNSCPVPTTPVYGRTPIFTCPNNNGCGCGNYYGANIM